MSTIGDRLSDIARHENVAMAHSIADKLSKKIHSMESELIQLIKAGTYKKRVAEFASSECDHLRMAVNYLQPVLKMRLDVSDTLTGCYVDADWSTRYHPNIRKL
jgi:hypothetical protein